MTQSKCDFSRLNRGPCRFSTIGTVLLGLTGLVVVTGCFRARTMPGSPIPARRVVPSVVERTRAFPSSGRNITVDCFEPTTGGKHPAIILLHGADGFKTYSDKYREAGKLLAKEGFVVLIPHYMDRSCLEEATDCKVIKQHFREWMASVSDAVDFAQRMDNVDAKRIGIVGHSLGAFLGLSVAVTKKGSHLAAVVDYYGGLPKPIALLGNINQMPPTLILHGEKDETVSPQEARDLVKLLSSRGLLHEVAFYKDQGHVFKGSDEEDANRRTLAFLKRHLSIGAASIASLDNIPVQKPE